MNFIADLHIHSRFSMATSKQITVEHLARWAMLKGIGVLGTGDFTHPKWREELRENLVLDENSGFYRLKSGKGPLFCLQTEISGIYKRDGRVRKVHNLVFMPDLEHVEKFCRRLETIGNLASDGRPILGLDSRDLLELALETSPRAVLIPAHIWTPWFAMFGSKSGFDRIEDCYGDLSSHIFALEMGLSSDPAMNRCLSALDDYALIANSDAHSGPHLGREANEFCGEPSYEGMFAALKTVAGRQEAGACRFVHTLEIYAEEGKYHLDGHRNCRISLQPAQSRALGDICPSCGKPLTIGVLHRVMELADRFEPRYKATDPEGRMIIPLAEILAQILNVGASSRKVQAKYLELTQNLAPELELLWQTPIEEIKKVHGLLGEAIDRMRAGQIFVEPGFDGQYGVIKLFAPGEVAAFGQGSVQAQPAPRPYKRQSFAPFLDARTEAEGGFSLSAAQARAVNAGMEPLFVIAGPGAGKTRALAERVRKLLADGVEPSQILAITFTRRAAGELRERLGASIKADTMHALALDMLREEGAQGTLLGEDMAYAAFGAANPELAKNKTRALWAEINYLCETLAPMPEAVQSAFNAYREHKRSQGWLDYADLLEWLKDHASPGRWRYLLIDEIQDLSPLQLAALKTLLPDGQGFFGIGDPDQSIYAFRGAVRDISGELRRMWPGLKTISLDASYRVRQKALDLAYAAIDKSQSAKMASMKAGACDLKIFTALNDRQEAAWISHQIADLLGSTSHSLADGRADADLALKDIAILVRLKAQIPAIARALEKASIPHEAPGLDPFWQEAQCAEFLRLAREGKANEPPREFLARLALPPLLAKSAPFISLCEMWEASGGWDKFFDDLAWLDEAEALRRKAESVKILTMHAAKGLEFEKVFIPGLEDGLIPLKKDLFLGPGPEARDQEANIFYVGLTRAASGIYLSYAEERSLFGRIHKLPPSPWLEKVKGFCQLSRQTRKVKQEADFLNLFERE